VKFRLEVNLNTILLIIIIIILLFFVYEYLKPGDGIKHILEAVYYSSNIFSIG